MQVGTTMKFEQRQLELDTSATASVEKSKVKAKSPKEVKKWSRFLRVTNKISRIINWYARREYYFYDFR